MVELGIAAAGPAEMDIVVAVLVLAVRHTHWSGSPDIHLASVRPVAAPNTAAVADTENCSHKHCRCFVVVVGRKDLKLVFAASGVAGVAGSARTGLKSSEVVSAGP